MVNFWVQDTGEEIVDAQGLLLSLSLVRDLQICFFSNHEQASLRRSQTWEITRRANTIPSSLKRELILAIL